MLHPSASLRVALLPDSGSGAGDTANLLRLADKALYAAKAAGRGCWREFGRLQPASVSAQRT